MILLMDESVIEPRWDQRYREGDTPWDTGVPSKELARVLDETRLAESRAPQRLRAIDLGCGAGTNAIYLAQRGFAATGVDGSAVALELARERAARAGVQVDWVLADVGALPPFPEPFDFVFDRGCYHCVRRANVAGYAASLARITRPGTRMLLLAGNANEQSDEGPPRVHEHEIRAELEPLFVIDELREFRFDDPGGVPGPLGWSCLMTRRA
jgi:SAM-dependent methyltransferase